MTTLRRIQPVLSFLAGAGLTLAFGAERTPPVAIVASHLFSVAAAPGTGQLPFDVSLDWDRPQPRITRAVLIFHGKGRDVDGYYRALIRAAEQAGGENESNSILIAPQFLIPEDTRAHRLPGEVLRWRQGTWESAADAESPIPVSSFEAIDDMLEHLADRRLFPDLKTVVLAGHSGGGQAVQRYAIVGNAERVLGGQIHVRYIVANPSSYFYFSGERPRFDGNAVRFEAANPGACPDFDRWRYGPAGVREKYVQRMAAAGWPALENAYAEKDVLYLLGTSDTDPQEKDLDTSCGGEMQGPNRFLRGQAYYAWLKKRHPAGWNQKLWFVPGVAHSATRMFTSPCGTAALFEQTACPGR